MARTTNYIWLLIAAISGFAVILVAGVFFFFFIYQPTQSRWPDPKALWEKSGKVNLSSIDSITLRTAYIGYFDEGAECRNLKAPVSGVSGDSLCSAYLTFNRDGSVTKRLEKRGDYRTGNSETVDKTEWKGTINAEEFNSLLKQLSEGKDFIDWPHVDSDRSNFTITVNHRGGFIQSFNNITTIPGGKFVDVFSGLDHGISWERVS